MNISVCIILAKVYIKFGSNCIWGGINGNVIFQEVDLNPKFMLEKNLSDDEVNGAG